MSNSLRDRISRRQKYAYELSRYTKNPGVQGSLTLFLSVLLVIVFLVFAIQPTVVKIAELQKQIAESEKVLSQLTSKANTLAVIAGKWDAISTKLPYLQSGIPFGPEYRTFNKELFILAKRNEVELANINMGEALIYAQLIEPYKLDKKMGVIPMSFTIRLGGNYESLTNFLRAMVKLDRIIQIDGVTMAPESMTSIKSKYPLSMNVAGVVYYMADTKQLAPIVDTGEKGKK